MTLPIDEWRPMVESDLERVASISDKVHGAYTESQATYAERISLFPQGCKVFTRNGETIGYLVCHPWHAATPPALNAVLGTIPADADCLYFHDIAILPEGRGSGAGGQALAMAEGLARDGGYATVSLVAVNGADSYWSSQGFTVVPDRPSYGEGSFAMSKPVA